MRSKQGRFYYSYFENNGIEIPQVLFGRKAMTNLDSVLKSRDITLSIKVCIAKAMVLPVAMYGYESCIIKKAEHWRIDAFKLCCWRRLWRVPWTARRSNQSILKEISPEYPLEGLMLKLQYFISTYFKSWKMMLWKCCTQYGNKFGKRSSGHRTGKGEFSFHSQRKAIPKNAQTTTQLHSSHTLAK